ncbi:hypothetical protein LC612_27770, partial [Nostoc sp. CHAB 5834]|nr:hypothetical protein [Nostoc sp. CHAB 5834]
TTITADVILFTSFYTIPTDMMRATFRTIHVLAPYIHTLLCNAGILYQVSGYLHTSYGKMPHE